MADGTSIVEARATARPSGAAPAVAFVHDYLTQRGGAERVVLNMLDAFPDAPLYTSLYNPSTTFEGYRDRDIRTSFLDRSQTLQRHHRIGLPLYAPVFQRVRVDADVTLCTSSGWAHGASAAGRKIVYCFAPARWLYQRDRYIGGSRSKDLPLRLMSPWLRRWDRKAAASADRYLTSSTVVQGQLRSIYGIDAEIVPPPHATDVHGRREPVIGLDSGFILSVGRLLPYKNVDAVIGAARWHPERRFVVVGEGPERRALEAVAPKNVVFLGAVTDAQLRWLYDEAAFLVAVSYEDFGLTPLEAAAHGRPTLALRFGGYLDTVTDGVTGLFTFDADDLSVATGIDRMLEVPWDEAALLRHALAFGIPSFQARLQAVVAEELAA